MVSVPARCYASRRIRKSLRNLNESRLFPAERPGRIQRERDRPLSQKSSEIRSFCQKVFEERKEYEDLLSRRCRAFKEAAEEAGLTTCPFNAGFCYDSGDNDNAVNEELQRQNFRHRYRRGIRIAISAISETACRMVPAKIAAAIKR